MAKSKIAYALSAIAMTLGSGFVAPMAWADGDVVSTFAELDAALCAGGNIVLGADIVADGWLGSGCEYKLTKNTTIDFNGYTITSAENRGYNIDFYDGVLTFENSKNAGGYTQLGSGNIAIAITNGKFVMNGGDVQSEDWGVVLWHDAKMEMNGGSITTNTNPAISGNGTTNPESGNYGANTEITINDGVIRSEGSTGIYHPQKDGVLTISGGTIYGYEAGVEIRAGALTISGGEISSADGVVYDAQPNGSGSTTTGAAVAVAQHTTKLPLSVTITGGEFTGPVAFSERNPQENGEEALAQIVTSLEGGVFVATSDKPVVVSEDVRHFIEGGDYSKVPVQEYLKDGYTAYNNETELAPYTVATEGHIRLSGTIYLEVGETYDLKEVIDRSGFEYGNFDPGDLENYVEVDDEKVITGVVPGTAVVSWSLVDAYEHSFEDSATVVVYEVAEDLEDTDQIIDAIVNSEDPDNFEYAEGITPEDVMDAVENGDEIVAIVTSDIISEDDVNAEEVDAIEAEVEESLPDSAEVAGYYNVSVELIAISDDGTVVLGNISETNEPVWVTVALPEDLAPVASGYVRTYYMVYYHNGETGMVRAFDNGDGTILFSADSFSTYALAYVDSAAEEDEEAPAETATPDTGTMTVMGASAMSASLIAAIVTGVLAAIVAFVKLSKISKR